MTPQETQEMLAKKQSLEWLVSHLRRLAIDWIKEAQVYEESAPIVSKLVTSLGQQVLDLLMERHEYTEGEAMDPNTYPRFLLESCLEFALMVESEARNEMARMEMLGCSPDGPAITHWKSMQQKCQNQIATLREELK